MPARSGRPVRSATTASPAMSTTTAASFLQVQRAVGTSIQQNYATYTYTPNGQPQTVKDANGNLTTYEYDGLRPEVEDGASRWRHRAPAPRAPRTTSSTATTASATAPRCASATAKTLTLQLRRAEPCAQQDSSAHRRPGCRATPCGYGYDVQGLQTFARFSSTTGTGVTQQYDGFGRLRSSSTNMDGTARAVTSDTTPTVTAPASRTRTEVLRVRPRRDDSLLFLRERLFDRACLQPLRRVRPPPTVSTVTTLPAPSPRSCSTRSSRRSIGHITWTTPNHPRRRHRVLVHPRARSRSQPTASSRPRSRPSTRPSPERQQVTAIAWHHGTFTLGCERQPHLGRRHDVRLRREPADERERRQDSRCIGSGEGAARCVPVRIEFERELWSGLPREGEYTWVELRCLDRMLRPITRIISTNLGRISMIRKALLLTVTAISAIAVRMRSHVNRYSWNRRAP